jgi:hypothetical protein
MPDDTAATDALRQIMEHLATGPEATAAGAPWRKQMRVSTARRFLHAALPMPEKLELVRLACPDDWRDKLRPRSQTPEWIEEELPEIAGPMDRTRRLFEELEDYADSVAEPGDWASSGQTTSRRESAAGH